VPPDICLAQRGSCCHWPKWPLPVCMGCPRRCTRANRESRGRRRGETDESHDALAHAHIHVGAHKICIFENYAAKSLSSGATPAPLKQLHLSRSRESSLSTASVTGSTPKKGPQPRHTPPPLHRSNTHVEKYRPQHDDFSLVSNH